MRNMKMFVCMPVVTGNGSKYVATNLAHYTKKLYPTQKVALVDCDFINPYLAERLSLHDSIHGIDNLTDKIDGGFLDKELFLENMVKLRSGVELLKGTKLNHNLNLIKKHHIEKMLELLKDNYDYIYIAVSNSAIAGTIYTLFESTDIVLVAKNNYSSYRNMDNALKLINNYKGENSDLHLIINQYSDVSEIVFTEHIEKNNIKNVELVPYNEITLDNANLEANLMQSVSFFNKNKSSDVFEDIVKELVKSK